MTGDSQSTLFDVPGGGMIRNDDAPAVLAYRVGEIEHSVRKLHEKFDGVAQHYVTTAALMIALEPIKGNIKELQDYNKDKETKQSNAQSQFRLAITVAVMSPVLNIVIAVMLNQGK